MQKFIVISLLVFVCFVIESVLADLFGSWFHPNLLIILIVFFNLFRGTRYSLITALLAGLLKDSFSVRIFGLNIFSFIVCAYFTTFLKLYIYQVGSAASRVLLVFLVSLVNVFIQYVLHVMFVPLDFAQMFVYVLIPEAFVTTILAVYVIERLKQCALRLFA